MIQAGLFQLVTGDPTVTGLIATRFYPDILPEPAELPAATYSGISLVDFRTLDNAGLNQTRMQIECWAATKLAALALAAAIFNVLDCFSGPMPNGLVADIVRDGQRDGFDHDLRLYYVSTDYLLSV